MNFPSLSSVLSLLTLLVVVIICSFPDEYQTSATTIISRRNKKPQESPKPKSLSNIVRSSVPKQSKCYASPLARQLSSSLTDHQNSFYRLNGNVVPTRYKIRFRVEPRRQKLYGHVQIAIFIHNRTQTIELNSVKLAINGAAFRTGKIRVDARMVYYCPEKETIVLEFSKPLHRGNANLTINYFGNLTKMIDSGLIKMADNQRVTITDFGPIDARRNFPCWDEPRFKSVFDLYLIVPRGYQALSNMAANRRRPYSAQYEEIRFESTPPMSTFQLSTIFGPKFELANSGNQSQTTANLNTTDKIQIQVYSIDARQSSPKDDHEFQYAIETAEKFLKYYEYYFDHQFPLKRLSLVAIRNYEQMSIEKFGLILFPSRQLSIGNSSLATEDELRTVAASIGHSLAHQWLGNLVTFGEWNQFWLCEGFASFMEKEALDSLFPHWKTWQRFAATEMRIGLDQDASQYSKPLSKQIVHPNDILQFYANENIYRKSIALLRMLKFSIGDETFQKATRMFIKNFAAENSPSATAADLLRCFYNATEKTGDDQKLAQIISRWTELAGFPVLHVEERQEEGEIRVLKLRQERFVSLNQNGSRPDSWRNDTWLIPINIINSFSPFSVTFQTVMSVHEAELTLNGIWDGEWVKLNPDFANFYRVHYSEDMLNKFVISIEEKLLPPMDRLNLVDDLFALIRAGYVRVDVGFRFLWSYENEDNPNVWASIVSSLTDVDMLISNIEQKGNKTNQVPSPSPLPNLTLREKFWNFGRDLLAKMYNRLYWYPDTRHRSVSHRTKLDDFAEQNLRENILCMMGRFRDANFTEVAIEKYGDYIEGRSDLDIGVLRCVFRAFSLFDEQRSNTTFDELFMFYREYDFPEARHLFSIALGSTDKAKQIQKVIDFSLEPVVRNEDTHTMISELCENSLAGRRMVLASISKQFYRFVKKFEDFNSMHHFFKPIIESISDSSQLLQLKKIFESSYGNERMSSMASSSSSSMRMLFDSLRYSFERVQQFELWRERDQSIIEQYFEDNPKSSGLFTADDITTANLNNNNDNYEFDFEDFDKKKKKKKKK